MRDLLHAAFDTATQILTRARGVLERGARTLLEAETLGESDLARLGQELAAVTGGMVTPAADPARLTA